MHTAMHSNALNEFPVVSVANGEDTRPRSSTMTTRTPLQQREAVEMVDSTMNTSSSEDVNEVATNRNDDEYMC